MSVATPVSRRHDAIQVRAEVLRHVTIPLGAMSGFPLMADESASPEMDPFRTGQDWRESDLKRAIAVAEEAGLRAYRVEIAPDGTITIIVGNEAAASDPA